MDTVRKVVHTLEELEEEARTFALALKSGESRGGTLVTLSGELGAGKTAFVQGVAKALGVEETVNSPTFVIEKVYGLPEGGVFARLIHIDAYRLSNIAELTALGFGEIVSNPGNLIMLEWPEKVVGAADYAFVNIIIEALPDGSRQITYA